MDQRIKNKGYKEIDSLLKQIRKRYNPLKIILFGSFARGDYDAYSDIDMLIVKETDKRFIDRIGEVLDMCNYKRQFEPLVYTPQELSDMSKWNFFIKTVLKEGKVIYERKRQ